MFKQIEVPNKTARICELKVGQRFIHLGIERVVVKITDDKLYYSCASENPHPREKSTYSAKSQWRVEVC